MPDPSFIHLRVRSGYSLLQSTVRPNELVQACVAAAMPAVAMTDEANLFGALEFSQAAAKAGVQPIIGCLLPIVSDAEEARLPGKSQPPALMPVLVQNATGYENLLKLLSLAYGLTEDRAEVAVDPEELCARADGLLLLTGGPDGPLGRRLRGRRQAEAEALLSRLIECFPNRLYIEIMRHGTAQEQQTEPVFLDYAERYDLPLVATNEVMFLTPDMQEAHDALLCVKDGVNVNMNERRTSSAEYRFKSAAEMTERFADLPEAVRNSVVIAQRCAYLVETHTPILPPFDTGAGRDEAGELRVQAEAGLEERLASAVFAPGMDEVARLKAAAPYRARLDYELGVIEQMQFPGYFLIVSDFIKWAKAQGIPVGPGRGSGAGSVVAWALSITDLDPLRFDLLFERFLNPERVSMPDFDIDFCMDRRGEVIRYVQSRYGAEKVAAIITFGKLQARAALRDVGRALGMPYGLCDKIAKLVPFNPANPPTLAQALEMEPRLKEWRDEDEQVNKLIDIAMRLEGLPRNASTHAAGVVIGDRPLDSLVPIYRDPRAAMPVTQFNMKDVEKAGLVKFDFLGLTTLTLLKLAEELVNQRGGALDLNGVPLDDEKTYALIARAETAGVFQLESGGMRDALRKLKPDRFEDIIAMVSLYRPGPMDNIPRYINVKHGEERAEYLHPALEPVLAETNGVIIYQEQVMRIAQDLAGYSLGAADLLRRAMGKKIKAEMDAQRDVFIKGAVERSIERPTASALFDLIAKFASYGFNKSHAAAYALLAYQTAYLKANHPVEFFAASMTMERDDQDKLTLFRTELARAGIALLPPDINRSLADFSVEDTDDGPAVRYALAALRGVGHAAMSELVAARTQSGPFEDLFDLTARVGAKHLNKRLLEGLIKAGALDGLHRSRAQACEAIEAALRYAHAKAEEDASDQVSLFGAAGAEAGPPKPPLPKVEEWAELARLQHEFAALGCYMSAHPLDGYAAAFARAQVVGAADLTALLRASNPPGVLRLAGVVLGKQERSTERSRFAFVQLSDRTGTYEVTLFSELLSRARDLLEPGRTLLIRADARLEGESVKILANDIEALEDGLSGERGGVEIRLTDTRDLQTLGHLLREGGVRGARVRLIVPVDTREAAVVSLPEHMGLAHTARADVARLASVAVVRDLVARR